MITDAPVRRIGPQALSLVCVITLAWPHAVRSTLYRTLYPLVGIEQTVLSAAPSRLVPLGYMADATDDLSVFRQVAAPAVVGVDDEALRLRKLTDLIYSYHPGNETSPLIPGGRERGPHAIFSEIQSGKFALCGQKTLVLAAMWRSLGGDVRQVRFSPGEDIAWYAAHYGVEVYSERWRKWLYFDVTLNGYATSSSGEPLSLVELNDQIVNGERPTLVASREHFDWNEEQFLDALRKNRLQVYSLDNRLRQQDPDRRFGALNFAYGFLSQLPKPFDRIVDAVTGDAATRFIALPSRPVSSGQAVALTASPSASGPSLSDPRPAARAGRGRHRRSF